MLPHNPLSDTDFQVRELYKLISKAHESITFNGSEFGLKVIPNLLRLNIDPNNDIGLKIIFKPVANDLMSVANYRAEAPRDPITMAKLRASEQFAMTEGLNIIHFTYFVMAFHRFSFDVAQTREIITKIITGNCSDLQPDLVQGVRRFLSPNILRLGTALQSVPNPQVGSIRQIHKTASMTRVKR